MAKVTSKLQVTIPKAIAQRYRLAPGDDIRWLPAGDAIRVVPQEVRDVPDLKERLAWFDEATKRQHLRDSRRKRTAETQPERGWTREELYSRGRAR